MDKLRSKDLENLLGIYPPFYIKDIELDDENETCKIVIADQKKLSLTSRFRESTNQKDYSWKHVRLGRFSTQIEFRAAESAYKRLTQPVCPGFFGKPDDDYTQLVMDKVLLGHARKLDPKCISELTDTDLEDVRKIIFLTENERLDEQNSNLLPLETDPVWIRIIRRELVIKTKSNPLRMLLHRLELIELNGGTNNTLQESISLLRAFFVKHRASLASEYQQIGVTPQSQPQQTTTGQQKTLKPDHPVWDSILTGEISLISSNVAFNLYITRLKDLYSPSLSAPEKKEIIVELMKYIKKNIAALKSELVSIKRISQSMDEKNNAEYIPPADNPIWTDILQDRLPLSSNRINLNLLLVKLKSQDGSVRDGSAQAELQKFFADNQRSLKAELDIINQKAQQAV